VSRPTVLSVQPAPVRGGPAVQHLKFLEALRDRYDLHVLLPAGQEMLREYEASGVGVHVLPRLPIVPRTKSPVAIARYLRDGRSIARDVRALVERIDARVVHTFGEGFPIAAWAGRRAGAGSIVHVIGMTIFQPPWVAAIYARLLRSVADRLVCCQRLIAELFRRHGVPESKLRVVYNALDPDAIARSAARGPAPEIERGTLALGMVGELDRRKGHLILVRAADIVLRERDDVRFYLVGSTAGDDTYLREVEAAIAECGRGDRIRLTGRVENALAWIAAMDVYCISSISEALSVAGLEAMALARPIVATRTGGNPEAVAHGETGLLSEPLNPDDFARTLLEILADHARRRSFGEAGRRRVEALFTMERNAALLARVFDESSRGGAKDPEER
jgi:glycosyltransferase involved in cell wall biosynthesis